MVYDSWVTCRKRWPTDAKSTWANCVSYDYPIKVLRGSDKYYSAKVGPGTNGEYYVRRREARVYYLPNIGGECYIMATAISAYMTRDGVTAK